MTMEPLEESEVLLGRVHQGDRGAFDKLLERHLPGLRAYVRLRTGHPIRDRETDSDLVQSVCREVLEKADRLRFGGENGFKRWLYRTAQRKIANRAIHHQRERRDVRRERRLSTGGSSDQDLLDCYQSFCTPSRHASAREALARVESAFDKLPDSYRDVILAAHVLGQSRAEIAEQIGKTEGAVRTMLSRALSQLAEYVDPET